VKLNCKPGDLAVLVRSKFGENIGKLCTVQQPYCDGEWFVEFFLPIAWASDVLGGPGAVGRHGVCPDAWLRPIRGHEGEDEALRLAGKPKSAEDLAVRISTLREEFDEACRKAVVS
jgi:hypothetical protein